MSLLSNTAAVIDRAYTKAAAAPHKCSFGRKRVKTPFCPSCKRNLSQMGCKNRNCKFFCDERFGATNWVQEDKRCGN